MMSLGGILLREEMERMYENGSGKWEDRNSHRGRHRMGMKTFRTNGDYVQGFHLPGEFRLFPHQ